MRDGICPFCGSDFQPGAVACPSCDLPLLTEHSQREAVAAGTSMLMMSSRPRPEFSRGGLRRIAIASNQAEAEMVESLLRSEGIPCVVRRTAGADVPDFLAAGRRDILVPEGGVTAARDLLQMDTPSITSMTTASATSPLALAAAVGAGAALVVAIVAAIAALT
ncbi:MAG TPA: DUF2007 domain-containing protein [Solirubrobacterales bacterium]|jgi:hypothetical protein|nr:DUF2007 domain-containing protein [Solirubrobacterales bacterium]